MKPSLRSGEVAVVRIGDQLEQQPSGLWPGHCEILAIDDWSDVELVSFLREMNRGPNGRDEGFSDGHNWSMGFVCHTTWISTSSEGPFSRRI